MDIKSILEKEFATESTLKESNSKIVLNNDSHSAKLYLKPLEKASTFSEIRNAVLISYLEQCEVDD